MRRGIIVGIDPGTTTAVAKLDLYGNLVGIRSKKEFSQKEIQEFITSGGASPVLVAVDVRKVPSTVEKIAAVFNVKVETPEQDMERREKSLVAGSFLKKYNQQTNNFHEVSALAAALGCFKKHENKFRQVERQLRERGIFDMVEEVKKEVVYGRSVNRVLEGRA